MKRQLLLLIFLFTIASCGWNHPCIMPRSYNVGEEKIATVGSAIVQIGCFAAQWEPRALLKILGTKPYVDVDFKPWTTNELLYSGREGDILHITYREFYLLFDSNGNETAHARPAFYQQVYYDLKKSDNIVFQDWVIQVIEANNQQIKFKVIKEPLRPDQTRQ